MTDISIIRSQDEQIPFCILHTSYIALHDLLLFWVTSVESLHVQGENSEILEIIYNEKKYLISSWQELASSYELS